MAKICENCNTTGEWNTYRLDAPYGPSIKHPSTLYVCDDCGVALPQEEYDALEDDDGMEE